MSVPVLSIIFMVVSLAIAVSLPIGLCIYFRKAKKADLMPFFIGCAVMILFAFVLEQIGHWSVLNSSAGAAIQGKLWLYALYSGVTAGLFEETGRFIAFKTILRKKRDKNANALMYGAGHGGTEALVLLGIASINNIIYSVLINTGNIAIITGPLYGDTLAQVETAIQTLITTPSWQFLMGGIERIFAVILHISLSVLVWFAAKNKKHCYLYPLAILIHLIMDAGTVLLSGTGISIALIEVFIAVLAVVVALFARKIWNRERMSIAI